MVHRRGYVVGPSMALISLLLLIGACAASPKGTQINPATSHSPLADSKVFYQPQNRDQDLTSAEWTDLFSALRAAGARQLVVQWTQHGEQQLAAEDEWLAPVLDAASEAGLGLWIGLHWDPDWFDKLWLPADELANYFESILAANLEQAEALAHWKSHEAFAGWYWPAELAESVFLEDKPAALLKQTMKALRQGLDGPIAVSSYFQASHGPQAYQGALQRWEGLGFVVWVQDGAGLIARENGDGAPYLDALPCSIGLIEEQFKQGSGPEETFWALPWHEAHGQRRDRSARHCQPRLLFSLRYLPEAEGYLDHHSE